MATKLFVGGLPYDVTEDQLHKMFTEFGQVISAKLILDRDTGRSKGFGFVEFATEEEANKAITSMNGKQVGGRSIAVNVARPMEPRGDRGGGGEAAEADTKVEAVAVVAAAAIAVTAAVEAAAVAAEDEAAENAGKSTFKKVLG